VLSKQKKKKEPTGREKSTAGRAKKKTVFFQDADPKIGNEKREPGRKFQEKEANAKGVGQNPYRKKRLSSEEK